MLEPVNTRYLYAVLLYIWIEFRFEISKFQVITLKTVRTLIGITTPSTLCFKKKRAPFLFSRLLRVFLTSVKHLAVLQQREFATEHMFQIL